MLGSFFDGFDIDTLGPEPDHDPVPTRVMLREDATARDDYVSLRADVVGVRIESRWRAAEGGISLTVSGAGSAGRARDWRAGRVIEAPVTFRRAARYLNDGVPDFERQLALEGTTLLGSVKSALLVEVVQRGSAFDEWAARMRGHVRRAISRWIGSEGAAPAIVTAVLIGDRAGLTDEIVDRLQRAGTYHVIAISGGNIAVLTGVVLVVLALAGIRGRVAALATIVALIVYANVATSGPSVWRATLMAVIYLAARVLDHRTPPWQATTLAAALMAVTSPLDVRSAGFILTFGATAALLESATWVSTRSSPTRRWSASKWVAASIAASLAVEIVLAPVSAQSFSRVTLAGPLLNLVAVPAMAVAQVAGLVVVIADAWSAIAAPAGWVAAAAASAIVESARLVDIAPGLSWRVPPPGFPVLVTYYVSLLTVLFVPRRRIRLAASVLALLALLHIFNAFGSGGSANVAGVRLTVFDVGQGEAMLLESGKHRLQIDGGGAPFGGGGFDLGARVLAPALWARGVHAADALLLTHGDPDHIGGAGILFDAFRTRRMWEGIVVPKHLPSRELRETARRAKASVEQRRSSESFTWGRARIRVLHPPEPDW